MDLGVKDRNEIHGNELKALYSRSLLKLFHMVR
jgi:hypothetical protein